ncbi:MAG TPA: hypothetical protein VF755_21260 [Catenuloplanes sp.]|jgi:hypothetical protein
MIDIKEAMKAAGLTPAQIASQRVRVNFARVVEAEELLHAAGARLTAQVQAAIEDASRGHTSTATGGTPLYATAARSGEFDAALTRLIERRMALSIATN